MSAREKLIEAMARAMCVNDEQDPDGGSYVLFAFYTDRPAWKDYERFATAALAALEAAGVRLVPVEATEEMVIAGEGRPDTYTRYVYSKMLAASPYTKDKPE